MDPIFTILCLAASAGSPTPAVLQPRQTVSAKRAAATVKIVSARRTEKWSEASTELTPRRPEDVVLVIDIAGVSIDEFQKLQKTARDRIFLSVGDQRYEPSIWVAGAWREADGSVKEERLILVIVPRAVRAFELHFVDSRPVGFTVGNAIVPKLP